MSTSSQVLSILGLCLLLLHTVRSLPLDFDVISKYAKNFADEVTNDSEDDYNINKNAEKITTSIPVSDLSDIDKRTFSISGDLQALADMLYYDDRGKGRGGSGSPHRSALLQLGKRSWRFPFRLPIQQKAARSQPRGSEPSIDKVTHALQRRSQQLSVSGPLSALANMLATEGRRRLHSESSSNRMRLLQVGKRADEDVEYSLDTDSTEY